MRFSLLTLASVLATTAVAVPSSTHVLHERRDAPLKKWAKRDRLDGSAVLPMRIGMTQSNLDKGYDYLMKVSHPDSEHYGNHYTAEEVHDIFAPSKDTVDSVRSWLESAGIARDRVSQSVNKQWMEFQATTDEANGLLRSDFHLFEHIPTGKMNVACDEYHVPVHVKDHVDYVTPGIRLLSGGDVVKYDNKLRKRNDLQKRGFKNGNSGFPPLPTSPLPGGNSTLQKAKATGLLGFCDQFITPQCIQTMYNITKATKAAPGNQLGIYEDTDFYAAEDLILFFATLAPNIPLTTRPKLEGVDGGFAPSLFAGGESDLDFEISYPIIYPQNSILFQTDDLHYENDFTFTGLFNNFLDAIDGSYCTFTADGITGNSKGIDPPYPDPTLLTGYNKPMQCGVYKPTNVISVSYGEQEDDLPTAYQQRQCTEFMKLGMQGTTIVFASGDSGVAARGADGGNADGCLGPAGKIFNPDYPATCPYLLTSGSTFLPTGASVQADAETATTRFPSGGGFSNIYPRPSYQDTAVQNYFATANPPYPYYSSTNNDSFGANGGIYNRIGRAYPDVSAIGDNVVIINNGIPTLIGGTSAAAPVWGAIINRINEERIAAGMSTVGFVNPTLYANPQALHDITVGNNSGCGTAGFSAAKGWDPVTGLGTPNYPALLSVFMGTA